MTAAAASNKSRGDDVAATTHEDDHAAGADSPIYRMVDRLRRLVAGWRTGGRPGHGVRQRGTATTSDRQRTTVTGGERRHAVAREHCTEA